MTTPNDKALPRWGGDEITIEGVKLTPEGEECVKAFDEYAARHGYSPTCPPGDLTPYRDWIKRTDDPEIRPGDIVTFGLDGIKHGRPSDYGHVEVIGSRPLRQIVRSFLARLADSVRGRK